MYSKSGPAASGKASEAAAAALPCLSRNNCTEPPSELLSTKHRKSASALAWNVQAMAEKHGLERLGFLTLTFADHVLCPKESQRRFRSLRCHVIGKRYVDWLRVYERQKSGRIHYHLLVVLPGDIRTGFDFDAIADHDYSSASPLLRSEWAFWRDTAKRYGFGRTELLPVKSTSEGIARYVGKYISKHMSAREWRDKGVRLVEYSRGARMASSHFTFLSDGSATWRRKVWLFAEIASERFGQDLRSFEALRRVLGPSWAYRHRQFILMLPDPAQGSHKPHESAANGPFSFWRRNRASLVLDHKPACDRSSGELTRSENLPQAGLGRCSQEVRSAHAQPQTVPSASPTMRSDAAAVLDINETSPRLANCPGKSLKLINQIWYIDNSITELKPCNYQELKTTSPPEL